MLATTTITTTRQYHDQLKAWRASLPKFDAESEQDFPLPTQPFTRAVFDLDGEMLGKHGVFFNIGVVFYQFRRRVGNLGAMIGHAKFIIPHAGSLVSFFDDIQGIGFGSICLTKSLEVVIEVDHVPWHETMQFGMKYDKKVFPDTGRVEITAKSQLYTLSTPPVLVAYSKAVFVQTPEIMQMGKRGDNSDNPQALQNAWNNLAPWRLRGDGPKDASMDFTLLSERSPAAPPAVPEWWTDAAGEIQPCEAFLSSSRPFDGRFFLYHAQRSHSACRAVLRTTRTAEGANSLLHGGAAAAAALEVLSALYPDLGQLEAVLILFKRPIQLFADVSIEWVYMEEEDGWVCVILDMQHNLLQQYKALLVPYDNEEDEDEEEEDEAALEPSRL